MLQKQNSNRSSIIVDLPSKVYHSTNHTVFVTLLDATSDDFIKCIKLSATFLNGDELYEKVVSFNPNIAILINFVFT